MKTIAAILLLPTPVLGAVSSVQQDLPAVERRIIEAVDSRVAEAVALLERVVNINSGTMNFAGVREVGRVLSAEFDALGFATEWVDGASFERAGHLLARRTGDQARFSRS